MKVSEQSLLSKLVGVTRLQCRLHSLESMARLWMCLQKPLVSTLSEGPVFSRWGGADLFFHFLWTAMCLFISSFRFGLHLTCCLGLHRLHSFRIIAFKIWRRPHQSYRIPPRWQGGNAKPKLRGTLQSDFPRVTPLAIQHKSCNLLQCTPL